MKFILRAWIIVIPIVFSDACVNRLDIEFNKSNGFIIVDGMITDQEGPYTVTLKRSLNPNDVLNVNSGTSARRVTIFDSEGSSEDLISSGLGVYQTKADGIRGKIGNKYHLEIELLDGSIFTSEPEELLANTSIDSLYYVWDESKPFDGTTEYGFRIFIDSEKPADENKDYFRWRFTGTYTSLTYPHLYRLNGTNCNSPPGPHDPLPCSGVIWDGQINGEGFLRTVGECSCCNCWVSEFAKKPILNDNLFTDGSYHKLEVGYVPFNEWTFSGGTYMVKMEQMRLNANSFNFWKIIKDQKEGSTSLFQPSIGSISSNFTSKNSNTSIAGVFSAISIRQKILFLHPGDAPIKVPAFRTDPIENCALWISCKNLFGNSSFSPPSEWE